MDLQRERDALVASKATLEKQKTARIKELEAELKTTREGRDTHYDVYRTDIRALTAQTQRIQRDLDAERCVLRAVFASGVIHGLIHALADSFLARSTRASL